MKQCILVFTAIFLIVLMNIVQINYLSKTSRYLLADIKELQNCVEREDYKKAYEAVESIEKTWASLKNGWRIFAERETINSIEDKIYGLKAYAKYEEQEELAAGADTLYNSINFAIENERLTFSNVL